MGGRGRGVLSVNIAWDTGGSGFMVDVGIESFHELRGTCAIYGRPFSFS